jgi:hypothetical protein
LDDYGYYATIRAYSISGYCVATVIDHLLLASNGEISWNGRDDNDRVLPTAPYILIFEAINEKGSVVREKWVVFVSSEL